MVPLYYISLFLHILAAAFWIGSMLFLPIVMLPAIRSEPNRTGLLYKTGIRFRLYGWIALIMLLVTGLTNIYVKGLPLTYDFLFSNPYGKLVGYKLVIFTVILLLSGFHDFYLGKKAIDAMGQSSANHLRQLARWSGRINLLLALMAAFLGIAFSRGGL